MRFPHIRSLIAFAALGIAAVATQAQIVAVSGSTSAPPATLGGFTLKTFAPDASPVFGDVTSIASPYGNITFDDTLEHLKIGTGWATWSNGYHGDVYYAFDDFTLTLPAFTKAFYFYAQPDDFDLYTINATASGVTTTQIVDGNGGATFFGFYATGSSFLSSISITSNTPTGLAIGEFGIFAPVPEPSTYALAGAAFLGGLVMIRKAKRKTAKA